ncbi:MAG: hypothetical protein ABIY70_07350 [Capsulimonas sp.]|uniref:hypothetical protein n=1 Tax=Capsulimonas sp. TaxID=2494211 RepID=UPI00326610AC
MKYFTLEWCEGQYGEGITEWNMTADQSYLLYLQELETNGDLSADVLKLARLPGVHDAYVMLVRHDKNRHILALNLRGGDSVMGYYDLSLRYDGADISPEHEQTLAYIARSTGYTYGPDALRHELDNTEDGRIEHRFLFHGPFWFAIRCDNLRWARLPRRNRRFARRFDRFPGGPVTTAHIEREK